MTLRYPAKKGQSVTEEIQAIQVTLNVRVKKTTNITFQGSLMDPPEGIEVTELSEIEFDGSALDFELPQIPARNKDRDRDKIQLMEAIIEEVRGQVEGEDFI